MEIYYKKILLILTILIGTLSTTQAQDTYFTKGATLQLYGELNGEVLNLQTSELRVLLDYETALIKIRFPIRSLKSSVDSLNGIFAQSDLEVSFDGKLGMEYINTENHPPINFTLEGWLTAGSSNTLVMGKGELHHVGETAYYACMLGLKMQLDFDNLNIEIPIPGLGNKFEVVLKKTLLQRDKN